MTERQGKSSRPQDPVTRTGAVRGEHCMALIGNWRAQDRIGDAFCRNNRERNSQYCKTHQFIARTDTRGSQKVLKKYNDMGQRKKVAPVHALATLISESAGNVEYLREEVNKLERLVIQGRKTREEIAGVVVLYNEERDRHERYVTDALRIRLEERQQELDEYHGRLFATVIKQFISDMKLMGEERKRALSLLAKIVRTTDEPKEEWDGPLQEARRLPPPPEVVDADFKEMVG